MPGPISQSYEPLICKCEHFKSVHNADGTCDCGCLQFEELPFEQSELGQSIDAWMNEMSEEDTNEQT
jgi:hypothetical protein